MAILAVDFSGLNGLTTKHQGDLYSSTAQPHLRYLSSDGQFASGIWNPFKNYGYTSPANASTTAITYTGSTLLGSYVHDSKNDTVYLAELGDSSNKYLKLWTMDGFDATTTSNIYTNDTVASGAVDLDLYQVAGTPVIDIVKKYNTSTDLWGIGFYPLEDYSGPIGANYSAFDTGLSKDITAITPGFTTKLGQKFDGEDVNSYSFQMIRIRVGPISELSSSLTMRLTVQADSAGVPSGTALHTAEKTVTFLRSIGRGGEFVYFDFGSNVSGLNSGTKFWLVLEVPTISELTGNSLWWLSTFGGNEMFTNSEMREYRTDWTYSVDTNDNFDFATIASQQSSWWLYSESPAGGDLGDYQSPVNRYSPNDGDAFLVTADNGYEYAFTNNAVHTLDGGISGGDRGTITIDALVFPDYLKLVDAIDTNGLMYIAINTGIKTGSSNTRTFNANICGVYIWDRQTTVTRTRDYIPLIGAKEVRKLYQTKDGNVRVIVINNDRQVEIRQLVNSTWQILYVLDTEAYPPYRDSISIINNYTVWMANDGKIYANGKATAQDKEGLFVIGDISTEASGTFSPGILINGNEVSSGQQQALIFSWMDDTTPKLSRWYLHGIGTIGSTVQYPHQGDIYTPVYYLPTMSTLKTMTFYCIPGTNSSTDVVATLKFYFNQSQTAGITKTVTKADVKKGYITVHLDKPYVNALQVELEYNPSMAMSVDDFCPSTGILDYEPTATSSASLAA